MHKVHDLVEEKREENKTSSRFKLEPSCADEEESERENCYVKHK